MKFNIITLIWSIALMLLTFQICLLWIDWQFTNTIVYKFILVMNGFMFGLVISEWSNNA
jgi:amino acid transporter